MTTELLPPEHLNKLIGGNYSGDYQSIGEQFRDIFLTWGGLKPTDRVLDVGCGCGRMAWGRVWTGCRNRAAAAQRTSSPSPAA